MHRAIEHFLTFLYDTGLDSRIYYDAMLGSGLFGELVKDGGAERAAPSNVGFLTWFCDLSRASLL